MVRVAHIDLVVGPGRGYRRVAGLLSIIAVLVLAGHRPLMPVALFVIALCAVICGLLACIANPHALLKYWRRPARWLGRVTPHRMSPGWNGSLRVCRDGSAEIGNRQGRWLPRCWTSRHLVVLRLAGLPQARTVMICHDRNHPDDFRRLLVWARFDPRDTAQPAALAGQP